MSRVGNAAETARVTLITAQTENKQPTVLHAADEKEASVEEKDNSWNRWLNVSNFVFEPHVRKSGRGAQSVRQGKRNWGKQQEADEVVDAIFERYDKDGCGHINYTEWVLATIPKKSLLTHDKLKKAFLEFDSLENGCV